MEYDIIREEIRSDFVREVNQMIEAGWELQGGVCFKETEPCSYMQAICLPDNKEK